MRRVSASLVLLVVTAALGLIAGIASSTAAPGQLMAGAAKVDASWHVGASAGQYADNGTFVGAHGVDPGLHAYAEERLLRDPVAPRCARARDRGRRRGEGRDRQERPLHPPGPALPAHRPDPRAGRLRDHAGEPHDGRHARSLLALLLVDLVGRLGLPGRLRRALLRLLREDAWRRPSSARPRTSSLPASAPR